MKVFLSYSFNDNELHLITLLIDLFTKEGHQIDTSDMFFGEPVEKYAYKIKNADLFLGIISEYGGSKDLVLKEYRYSKKCKVPSVLLIEDSLVVPDNIKNYISFDRYNPEKAIDELLGNNKAVNPKSKSKTKDLENALIAGGIVVGVAALISLLAGGSKK